MSQTKPTETEVITYAKSYIISGDQSKAFRETFPKSKATKSSITTKACNMHKLVNVQSMISHLRTQIVGGTEKNAVIGVNEIVDELEQARVIAMTPDDNGKSQPAAMVGASMGKAKILGLLVDRVVTTEMTQEEWLKQLT